MKKNLRKRYLIFFSEFIINSRISEYEIKACSSGNECINRMPTTWILYGSNDKVNWEKIDEQKQKIEWIKGEERVFEINNDKKFKFARFNFLSLNSILEDVIRIESVKFYKNQK